MKKPLGRITPITTLSALLLSISCASQSRQPSATPAPAQQRPAPPAPAPLTERQQALISKIEQALNPAQDPCQDFYEYACGGWTKTNSVPADQSRWMRSFNVISEQNDAALKALLERPVTEDATAPRAKTFYQSCMDEANLMSAGLETLKPWLKRVESVKDLDGLMLTLAAMHDHGIGGLFSFWVSPDAKEPTRYAAYTRQGGLGLPDRAFYLEPQHAQTLEAYEQLIAATLERQGAAPKQAKAQATKIVAFEKELATLSKPRAELRDPDKLYNKRPVAELAKSSALPWQAYLKARGLEGVVELIVQTPEFTDKLQTLLKAQKADTWRAYLRWHLLREVAPSLGGAYEEAHFAFYGQRLNGQKEQKPRWKRCVRATDGALGFELGQGFVQEHFPDQSKATAQALVKAIEDAFEANLADVAWMDATTRERALGKLNTIRNKIGYPDAWRSYAGLEISPGAHMANSLSATAFEIRRRNTRYDQPVDFEEWYMTPPTVNAYYSASGNQIVFPAGILQDPFFDRDFPMAINFGGIGMVIGHEITHGFDDNGRKFDEKGRLTMWWQPEAIKAFEERAQCVKDQYDAIEVQPKQHINGKLTLGENIADLGGLKLAYMGYERWLKEHPETSPIKGITPQQLFFVGFAQTWCGQTTEENERQRLMTDSHSPPRYRVNQSVSNSPAFHKAFQCAPGAPMNPPNQCQVW